jgi:hypothetical protein
MNKAYRSIFHASKNLSIGIDRDGVQPYWVFNAFWCPIGYFRILIMWMIFSECSHIIIKTRLFSFNYQILLIIDYTL